MAKLLSSWLGQQIETDLALGISWVQGRIERRNGVKQEQNDDLDWKNLYAEDGSNLVIFGDRAYEQRSNVQIQQVDPLILSDGTTTITAEFTRKCLRNLLENYHGKRISQDSVGSLIAVRKYKITVTTFGPASTRILVSVESIDWHGGAQSRLIGHPQPLHTRARFLDLLQRYQDVRAKDRSRSEIPFLNSQASGADKQVDAVEVEDSMNTPLSTQIPFGTQVAQPIGRPNRDDHDIEILGVNRLEPLLAGNSQREELRTTKKASGPSLEALLMLINRKKTPVDVQNQDAKQEEWLHVRGQENEPPKEDDMHTLAPNMSPELAAQHNMTAPTGPSTVDTDHNGDMPEESKLPSTIHQEVTKRKNDTRIVDDYYTPGPSFIMGWHHAAIAVPRDQRTSLNKIESFLPSLPGYRFPEGNIPIEILVELNRTAARDFEYIQDAGDAPTAKIESDTESSDSDTDMDREGSPDPVATSHFESEPPSSAISWPPSPPPGSWQPQRQMDPGLPPDSSLPGPGNRFSSLSQSNEAPIPVKRPVAHHSTGFKSSQTTLQQNFAHDRQSQIRLESLGPDPSGGRDLQGPPSSPPYNPEAEDVVMDTSSSEDMEISVPQGLGHDREAAASSSDSKTSKAMPAPFGKVLPKSVIQIKDTPYNKGNSVAFHTSSSSAQKQTSSGSSKDASSTSIVYGTYDDGIPSASEGNVSKVDGAVSSKISAPTEDGAQTVVSVLQAMDGPSISANVQSSSMTFHNGFQPEPSPISTQMSHQPSDPKSPQSSSQSRNGAGAFVRSPQIVPYETSRLDMPTAKRKLIESPGKKDGHKSKRRDRIPHKNFQFSQEGLLSQDPVTVLRQQKKEFINGRGSACPFDENREGDALTMDGNGSPPQGVPTPTAQSDRRNNAPTTPSILSIFARRETSPQTPLIPTQEALLMDVDAGASGFTPSPRPSGTQNTPSPLVRPSAGPDLQPEQSRDLSQYPTGYTYVGGHYRQLPQAHVGQSHRSQLPFRASQSPSPRSILPHPSPATEVQPPHEQHQFTDLQHVLSTQVRQTIFDRFKNMYPDYTGDTKHFVGQCRQILLLDQEDKMVPKWQWDDYIVRNRIDFKGYAFKRMEEGEDVGEYHRFYKDHIQTVIYNKGVIKDASTLLRALEELGDGSAVPRLFSTPGSSTPSQRRPSSLQKGRNGKHNKRSLPWNKGNCLSSLASSPDFDGRRDYVPGGWSRWRF
ncbi:hypothetical protein K469DRAFT_305666 [Zopfia rhizophila CBS 207.26]|uniref:Shelterin complex subunit TPP1/Est3 domain-containing protein n=1 Tax=Zopfia rhizophila CBS 207.26 TaxID=1314779 RepID=A0A6A6EN25_9PEZI|nr:hypothetical protein K469DRAFT_305666 [Zopfia rhizophila CBS 207.26]